MLLTEWSRRRGPAYFQALLGLTICHLDFRVSYTAIGNAAFGAREGAHDDTILAVALAVYGLEGRSRVVVGPLLLG